MINKSIKIFRKKLSFILYVLELSGRNGFWLFSIVQIRCDDYSCFKRANFLIKLAVVCES